MPRLQPLSLLDTVRVASPCPASWQEMSGDDRVRHCSICQQAVYDLSALTRPEAEKLIRERDGRLCIRIHRRNDGKVMTRDCPVGRLQVVRRRVAAAIGTAAVLLFTLIGWLAGRPDARARAIATVSRVREVEPIRTVVDWVEPRTRVTAGACISPGGLGASNQPEALDIPPRELPPTIGKSGAQ
ncbi:MAG TPA: hypothetical protein VKD71_04785 [Gemmataceae bacterium]|nr:hypothetical protein [Gemmataceae bacterium]